MKLHRNIDIFVPKATESAHGRVQSDFFLPQREKWAPYHAVRDVIGPGDKYFDMSTIERGKRHKDISSCMRTYEPMNHMAYDYGVIIIS